MNAFLIFAFLFFVGSIAGWCMEVVFRRFFSRANPERKWINPGFLVGPYLPLYGFSLCVLYALAGCEKYIAINNAALEKLVLFVIMSAAVTLLEYIAGIIFIKGMKVKLWDYSTQWGNVNGIICPKFTLMWMALSAAYYFLVHPRILSALQWLAENLAFSFAIGFFFGVFAIDVAYSTRLLVRIRKFAADNGMIVKYEELKAHIREQNEKTRERARFVLAMHGVKPLSELLKEYKEKHDEKNGESFFDGKN